MQSNQSFHCHQLLSLAAALQVSSHPPISTPLIFFTFTLVHFPLPPHFLQENYNTLLIKYAEAENTIDRMRLEAKVVHLEVGLSFIKV